MSNHPDNLTDRSPHAPWNQPDAEAVKGYIDPNQFDAEAFEAHYKAIKELDEVMAYEDAIEAAKTAANSFGFAVVVNPYTESGFDMDPVTIYPNRKN